VAVRSAVIRARLAYEADPAGFADRYCTRDAELAARIAAARARVADVMLPDRELHRIAALCAAFDVDGMRADLVVARTAVAHAAWRGAAGASEATGTTIVVGEEDIRAAAELALPHRRRRDPFDDPGLDPGQLDEALAAAAADADGGPGPDEDPDPEPPDKRPADSELQPRQGNSSSSRPAAAPSATFRARALRVPGVGDGASGRRSAARTSTGAAVRAAAVREDGHGVHLFATMLAAAECHDNAGPLRPRPEDVRRAVRIGREGNLVIFVVDASGSMAARDRMAAVGGASLSLLRDAYQRRDKVAVIAFRGDGARLVLPPTTSAHIAARRLTRLSTGGATPLAEGLLAACDVVVRERARDRSRRPLVVVLTDGRATAGPDPLRRSHTAAGRLVAEGAAAVVVDCETAYVKLGLAGELAVHLRAPVLRLEQLRADVLAQAVRRAA
jgi:magnesium chelatase subunit D